MPAHQGANIASKLVMRVRFPSPAQRPRSFPTGSRIGRSGWARGCAGGLGGGRRLLGLDSSELDDGRHQQQQEDQQDEPTQRPSMHDLVVDEHADQHAQQRIDRADRGQARRDGPAWNARWVRNCPAAPVRRSAYSCQLLTSANRPWAAKTSLAALMSAAVSAYTAPTATPSKAARPVGGTVRRARTTQATIAVKMATPVTTAAPSVGRLRAAAARRRTGEEEEARSGRPPARRPTAVPER